MSRRATAFVSSIALAAWLWPIRAAAADSWIEVKTPSFQVWSNAGEGTTRTLAWQFEQIRSATRMVWPGARVDLTRPLLVLTVKDEMSMKALAPHYWEAKSGIRPVSVWVTGPERHYLAIRADTRGQDTDTLNPYQTAYHSYLGLVVQASFARDLPLWFSQGLAGVLSNTVVREDHIRVGMPIPWHLQQLQDRTRLPLARLVEVSRSSPEYLEATRREQFDAQSWAFVHFLLFSERGALRSRFDQFCVLLGSGKDARVAVKEALGPLQDYESPFVQYVNRRLMSYVRLNVDAGVKREGFVVRRLESHEAALGRASFHVAMGRPVEARALIAEARKTESAAAASHAAEGLLLDAERKHDEARAAYGRAVELGAPNAYAYYRWAQLNWGQRLDPDALARIEGALAKAVAVDASFAAAHSFLAQTRSALGRPVDDIVPLVNRAISLEPAEPYHRIVAARVFYRIQSHVAAAQHARTALSMELSDEERAEAQELLALIERQLQKIPSH